MSRTACTEPQCLYNGALYLYLLIRLVVAAETNGRGTVSYLEPFLSRASVKSQWSQGSNTL